MISKKLLTEIKLSSTPAYRLAQKAEIDPSTLSKMVCGIIKIKPEDKRVVRVGRLLGFEPEECFEKGKSIGIDV